MLPVLSPANGWSVLLLFLVRPGFMLVLVLVLLLLRARIQNS